MSTSPFVCARDGLPLSTHRGAWRHALGGGTGAIPRHRRHKPVPVPVPRADFDRAFGAHTPPEEARALLAGFRDLDAQINGKKEP